MEQKLVLIRPANGCACVTCGRLADMLADTGSCLDCMHTRSDSKRFRYFMSQTCKRCKREVGIIASDDVCLDCAHKYFGRPPMSESEWMRIVPRPRD